MADRDELQKKLQTSKEQVSDDSRKQRTFHVHDSLEPELEKMQGKKPFCKTCMMSLVFSWI